MFKYDILYKKQKQIFQEIKKNKYISDNFYFAWWTNLVINYLWHRYSDDLDFFSNDKVNTNEIDIFFSNIKTQLWIKTIQKRKVYDRNIYVLWYNDWDELKMEWTKYFKPQFELQVVDWIKCENIKDCFLNKIATVYDRFDVKDRVDIYFLIQNEEISWKLKNKYFEKKFWRNLSTDQIWQLFNDASNRINILPKMISKLSIQHLSDFLKKQSKMLWYVSFN